MWETASGCEVIRLAHGGAGTAISVVTGVVFCPDGTRIATASGDGIARVWDIVSGRELTRLVHRAWVHAVALSADGARIATASYDKTARVWELPSGCEVAHLVHEDAVRDVAFSADGTRIATASDDGVARVWDTASGGEIVRFNHRRVGLAASVNSVAFIPDGTRIATASGSTAYVWDIAGGRECASLSLMGLATPWWSRRRRELHSVAFSPDGTRIAIASGSATPPLLALSRGSLRAGLGDATVWSAE